MWQGKPGNETRETWEWGCGSLGMKLWQSGNEGTYRSKQLPAGDVELYLLSICFHVTIVSSHLTLHVVANGDYGALCELQQTHYLAWHHIHGSLWHHAHALMLSGAAKHVATLSKVGRLFRQLIEENGWFTLWGSGEKKEVTIHTKTSWLGTWPDYTVMFTRRSS